MPPSPDAMTLCPQTTSAGPKGVAPVSAGSSSENMSGVVLSPELRQELECET